jgi:prepilin-type N-terminal cleavage/methylation domain-containing protein
MFKKLKLKNKKNQNHKTGFTIIEIITVIMIIAVGMTGVLSLIVQNVRNQSINKNTFIAYQLAQEGVELIREVRDTNWRNGRAWDSRLSSGIYYMDYTDTAPNDAIPLMPGAGRLKLGTNGFYESNPSTDNLVEGNFYRIIAINFNSDNSKMLVNSNIYWIERGGMHNYTLQAELYNWK